MSDPNQPGYGGPEQPYGQQPQYPPPGPGAPPPGYNPYGAAPQGYGYGGYGPVQSSGKATASLVCGIVGFLCGISAIAAIVLGFMAKNEIKASNGTITGDGKATAGIVLGVIVVAFSILFTIIALSS